ITAGGRASWPRCTSDTRRSWRRCAGADFGTTRTSIPGSRQAAISRKRSSTRSTGRSRSCGRRNAVATSARREAPMTELSRRGWLRRMAGAGAALLSSPRLLEGLERLQARPLIRRAIPGTDELLPVIGLGSADTFSETALRESRREEYETIGAVLRALVDGGGSVFDTAYGYGASEQVAGQVAEELGMGDRIWWSTKVNAARVSGGGVSGPADPAATRYQIERSFLRLRRPQIDLFQVHNMGDPPTQLALLNELKAQ